MITALITGIGGTRSLAVLKALRQDLPDVRTIGTDANYFNAGSFQCDKSYIVPLASDSKYLPTLEKLIIDEHVDIIFATVEKEVAFLSQHKAEIEAKHKVSVLVPEPQIIEFCLDKFKTQQYLERSDFISIPTIYAGDRAEMDRFAANHGFPLIRKPISGYGSKGLSLIKSAAELADTPADPSYVLQRHIANTDSETYYHTELNEYTAEIFVNADLSVAGGIILKRALHNGETLAGYLVRDDQVLDYLTRIARHLKIKGPVNFQFRIEEGQSYVFEINPLYSGTTAVRAHLGFNSVALAVASFVQGKHRTISQTELKPTYFLRYLEEVFIDPADLTKLRDEHVIDRT